MSSTVTFLRVVLLQLSTIVAIQVILGICGAIPQIQVLNGNDVMFHHAQLMNATHSHLHIQEQPVPLFQDYHARPGHQVHLTHQMHLMSLIVTFLMVMLLQLQIIAAIQVIVDISGAIPKILILSGKDVIFLHVQVMNATIHCQHTTVLSAPLHQDYHANPGPQVHLTHRTHLMSSTVTFLRVVLLELSTIVAIQVILGISGATPQIQVLNGNDVIFHPVAQVLDL